METGIKKSVNVKTLLVLFYPGYNEIFTGLPVRS